MLSRRSCWLLSRFRHCAVVINYCKSSNVPNEKLLAFKEKLNNGPRLSEFLLTSGVDNASATSPNVDQPPYLQQSIETDRKVYIETYGCQMNFNDSEIVLSILKKAGFKSTTELTDADVIFLMTCSIREGAEQKIWRRLKYFQNIKNKQKLKSSHLKVGVLGCMAERLKHRMLEKEKLVDIVAGPDSYRDLPNLLSLADEGQKAVNVMFLADETYADILPVRLNSTLKTAFVSIMRGCDNMCSYCIVPFTRGRERSRPVSSILDEIRHLSDLGIKEITLLGQNVNSYRDMSESSIFFSESSAPLSAGFHTIYKKRYGGMRFADLLYLAADINPEIRIRFTSPHPKDFPDEVLHVINEKANVCKLIHLPAQSGNSKVLENMNRGYTREAYLELVDHIRHLVPDVAFTSDIICGFCDETEEQHRDTLTLMEKVKYEFAFVFPFSLREKTKAFRWLVDNVPEEVKKRRAEECANLFRACAKQLHEKEIGKYHLIQVLGPSKRTNLDWSGRNDWSTKVIYPQVEIPIEEGSNIKKLPSAGDYVVVQITGCSSQTLKGIPLHLTTLKNFCDKKTTYL